MRCPTPCRNCGDVVELSDLHFHVLAYCDCSPGGGCVHGLCEECESAFRDHKHAEELMAGEDWSD
jgi:hypothetical protein